MGREIRRVPPNWEHPKGNDGEYQSMFDQSFDDAVNEWAEEFKKWDPVDHDGEEFAEGWGNPPDRKCYLPVFMEEPTWYQVYQTVSEGTPVSPPFETPEELARYLSDNGDFWHQARVERGSRQAGEKPSYEDALRFVEAGFACSMVVIRDGNSTEILGPYEQNRLD